MRPYDRYKKERQYYNKFGTCKHAKDCQVLRPEDYTRCPGLSGYLCEPMRQYYLYGATPPKQRQPISFHTTTNTPKKAHPSFLQCLCALTGVALLIILIYKCGVPGLVFGVEPSACLVAMAICAYKKTCFPVSSDIREIWSDRFISACVLLLIGVFIACIQIPYWMGCDVSLWLWFVSASIMLAPLGFLTQGYLNYKANEQRKTRRIK